jgi:phosphate transport system substrate-binding protein
MFDAGASTQVPSTHVRQGIVSKSSSSITRAVAGSVGVILLALTGVAFAAPDPASIVRGTGGSSATRVLAQWKAPFTKESGIGVDFVPANSGVGIREASAHRVDFACTEIPLSVEDLAGNELVQFPLLIGGVVVVVNIPGVGPGDLRLNANVVSRIFLGEIRFWNDDEIRALNPGLNLSRLPIKPIVRETPASTTLALTTFLAKADRTWASRVGASDQPQWPVPTLKAATVQVMGEKVQSTQGAIGYINFDEAYRNKLAYALLRNQAGQYVRPSHESFLTATRAAGLGRTDDRIPVLIYVEGDGAWPIVEITYVLVDRKPKNVERARSTLKFFFWAFLQGDQMAADTGFVPLPSSIQARNVRRFRDVLGPDNAPLDFLK